MYFSNVDRSFVVSFLSGFLNVNFVSLDCILFYMKIIIEIVLKENCLCFIDCGVFFLDR